MISQTITGLPPTMVTVTGNFIRKYALTCLKRRGLCGVAISNSDGKYYTLTDVLVGSTTMLDIVVLLSNAKCELGLTDVEQKESSITCVSESFTDLSAILSSKFGIQIPYIGSLESPCVITLCFGVFDKDMSSEDIQPYLEDGYIPIPFSVVDKFTIDYSRQAEGVLTYSCSEELTGLANLLNIIQNQIDASQEV